MQAIKALPLHRMCTSCHTVLRFAMACSVYSMTYGQFVAAARREMFQDGQKGAGIARNLYQDAFLRGRFDPAGLGASPANTRRWLELFDIDLPFKKHEIIADAQEGGASKVIWTLSDGLSIESVLVPMPSREGDKASLCISSQVGCRMACRFCQTGQMGLLRNLSVQEIVGQVVATRRLLGLDFGNVVFMGMGEPLDNFGAVLDAVDILLDPSGLAFAQERITLCTVGLVSGIDALAQKPYKRLGLSLSLNSARQETRASLMPLGKVWTLEHLTASLSGYRPRANFVLALNWCLMPGINDSAEEVMALQDLIGKLGKVLVNVIPYNPGTEPIARAPSQGEVDSFLALLKAAGIPAKVRGTRGRSIMAACGQLGGQIGGSEI